MSVLVEIIDSFITGKIRIIEKNDANVPGNTLT